MTNDLTVMRERLRRETAALLGLDIDNLTPSQSIRLDRAATLRLELDDIESRKLVGAQFDAQKYIAISEALERLMTPGISAAINQPDFSHARENFTNLIAAQVERHEAALRSDNPARRDAAIRTLAPGIGAIIAELKADNDRLRAQPVAPSVVDGPPTAAPSPPQLSNQPPQQPSSAPPAHYLKGPPEPWRVVDGGRDRWSNKG